ncbi:hypothetical protein OSTOST_00508 [Ostertagia ostertagi]
MDKEAWYDLDTGTAGDMLELSHKLPEIGRNRVEDLIILLNNNGRQPGVTCWSTSRNGASLRIAPPRGPHHSPGGQKGWIDSIVRGL